jgi:geranylgeranyl pyrophosphate synthase
MDDDDLRRGRSSCHRAFDEATAILAGDALQALAFGVLGGAPSIGTLPDSDRRIAMITLLAERIGTRGMAGGQAIDLQAVGREISAERLREMHARKTGALIEASVLLGAVAAGVLSGPVFDGLLQYGRRLGLAFQIQDDILDVEGHEAQLGKAAGADALRRKPTWPSVHGLEASRTAAEALIRESLEILNALPLSPLQRTRLGQLARFVVVRRH